MPKPAYARLASEGVTITQLREATTNIIWVDPNKEDTIASPNFVWEINQPIWVKVRSKIDAWKAIGANRVVLDWIANGVKPEFLERPKPFYYPAYKVKPKQKEAWT